MKIISISGMIGSGKDTLALHLITNHGFIKGSFSKALKDCISAVFGWDRELLEGITPEARAWRELPDRWWTERLDIDVDITPRWALQNFGTDAVRRHFHPDIWTAATERWLADHKDKNIVFTDTRFFNEFTMLRSHGAKILGVYRKTPKWLESFYQKVDYYLVNLKADGVMHVDLTRPFYQRLAVSSAMSALRDIGVELHESEALLLLWNRYDGIIDNTGKLTLATEKLETFL